MGIVWVDPDPHDPIFRGGPLLLVKQPPPPPAPVDATPPAPGPEPIESLYCTTELGAERPIHRCGHPMSPGKVRHGKQQWRCPRRSCDTAQRRYEESSKGREAHDRRNERRLIAGGMYLGMAGFTKREREELLRDANGDSEDA